MKILKILILGLLIASCNSKEQKTTKVDYPEKTSLSQKDTKLMASMERGKSVYNDLCITCHMANGEGVPKAFPPLANADYLRDNQDKSIIGIKNGMSGEMVVNGITYNSAMAPLGLSNEEVADVMNYINNSWGNDYGEFITAEDVAKTLNK